MAVWTDTDEAKHRQLAAQVRAYFINARTPLRPERPDF